MKKSRAVSETKKKNQKKNRLGKRGKLKIGSKSPFYAKQQEKQEKAERFNFKRNQKEDVKKDVRSNGDDENDDREDMVDEDTDAFLKGTARYGGYSFVPKNMVGKRRLNDEVDDGYVSPTEAYEERAAKRLKEESKIKSLLPIKTKEGLIPQTVEVEEKEKDEETGAKEEPEEAPPLSAAELFALRQKKLEDAKVAIGMLASNVMENPEEWIGNMANILEFFENPDAEVSLTVRKLAAVSMVALLTDLAPGYEIKHTNQPGQKLKKETRKIYTYEDRLLKYYRQFLKALEVHVMKLKKRKCNEVDFRLGVLSLKCMCDLLVRLPHFNFSKNIVHAVVPFAVFKVSEPRTIVCSALKQLFKEDMKGEISLEAVRQINRQVKNCHHRCPPECLETLLSLRIKDVNLDKEKMDEINRYRTLTRKEKLLQLSKRERRRHKKVERLKKEINEAKAEENKSSKGKHQTEIVKTVFTMYFRILKASSMSHLLGVALEGLAKFAHTINIDFFTDLVSVFDGLLKSGNLPYRQVLHCVQVVFTILSGQGEALNIDPIHFYGHMYRALLELHAGSLTENFSVALQTLEVMLIKRYKRVSVPRALAYAKRVATMALQAQHSGAGALLAFLRQMFIAFKKADFLLDHDSSIGNGIFMPELAEPEHCNASNTALWELHPLTMHYHPTVRKLARYIQTGLPTTGNGVLPPEVSKKSPLELFNELESSTSDVCAELVSPTGEYVAKKVNSMRLMQTDLDDLCKNVSESLREESFDIRIDG